MKQPFKAASIVLVGSFGSRLFPLIKAKIAELDAAGSLLDTGVVDLSVGHATTTIPHIIDLSPDNEDRKQSIVYNSNENEAYGTLLESLGARLVQVHLQTKVTPAPLIFIVDKQCLAFSCSMLQEVKRRLPLHSIIIVAGIIQSDLQQERIVQGLKATQVLYEQEVIEKIIVLDGRSPFALAHGEETQYLFTAEALVSLLLTHRHTLNNMSGNELCKLMHSGTPFASFAFASKALVLGKIPTRLPILPGLKERTEMGDFGDILTQVQEAVRRCMQDATCTTFPVPVDVTAPAVVVVDTPVKIADGGFNKIVSATSRFVNRTYPFTTSAVVSGNGCSYPTDSTSRFRVQASLLYQLPGMLPDDKYQKNETLIQLMPLSTPPKVGTTNGNGQKKVVTNMPSSRKPRTSSRKTAQSA